MASFNSGLLLAMAGLAPETFPGADAPIELGERNCGAPPRFCAGNVTLPAPRPMGSCEGERLALQALKAFTQGCEARIVAAAPRAQALGRAIQTQVRYFKARLTKALGHAVQSAKLWAAQTRNGVLLQIARAHQERAAQAARALSVWQQRANDTWSTVLGGLRRYAAGKVVLCGELEFAGRYRDIGPRVWSEVDFL